jgi:hypothetical protein
MPSGAGRRYVQFRLRLTCPIRSLVLDCLHLNATKTSTCVPEPVAADRRDSSRGANIKDQGDCSAMQVSSHIAQLLRYYETVHYAGIVRVFCSWLDGDRLQVQDVRQHGVVSLNHILIYQNARSGEMMPPYLVVFRLRDLELHAISTNSASV